jgi:hypothetical protein
LRRWAIAGRLAAVLSVLLLAGGLVPLAAMLVALFAAAWTRKGRSAAASTGSSPAPPPARGDAP